MAALVNVVAQLVLMNLFLASGPHLYGVEVIKDIIQNKEWTDMSPFPRSTMCDFKVLCNIMLYILTLNLSFSLIINSRLNNLTKVITFPASQISRIGPINM